MMFRLLFAATLAAFTLAAQPAPPKLEFEVASIKLAPPFDPQKIMAGKLHIGMSVDAARVDIGALSIADLIRIAYAVKPHQVSGPDWMASQRFDIVAKIPEGVSKDKAPEMLQALLADRFKLVIHRENKEHAVYALIVGKNGSKMKEAAPDTSTPEAAPGGENQVSVKPSSDGKGMSVGGGKMGQTKVTMTEAGAMRMEFAKMPMASFADMLSRFVDRPVVDMTELKGNYQFALDLSMEEMRQVARSTGMAAGMPMPPPPAGGPADAASTPSGGSIFTAVQQLGLKLDPRKTAVETIFIDHVEKIPSEN